MRDVAFGTAHLYGLVPPDRSPALLRAAWSAGVRRYDTAPSYGAGRSEAELAAWLRHVDEDVVVTTKVGIAAPLGPAGVRRLVRRAARSLPPGVRAALRGRALAATHGRFRVDDVRASVESSLRRLGPLQRLLLHEVDASDVTSELVDLLSGYVDRGDVRNVGVATRNERTALALAAAPGLFTVAHVEAGPLSEPVELPAHVQVRVGHGLLGPGGEHLRRLCAVLRSSPELAAEWRHSVAGTRLEGSEGLASALLAGPAATAVDEVIVATSRPGAVAATVHSACAAAPLPDEVTQLLGRLVATVRPPGSG